jgi:hypothetical protein
MVSSWMLRRVVLGRTDVSEEIRASFTRVIRVVDLATTLAITNNRRKLLEDTILHSHCRENVNSYLKEMLPVSTDNGCALMKLLRLEYKGEAQCSDLLSK